MSLEAELLQIIKQQQTQLKEQQKEQENALKLIQTQFDTINELEKYNTTLEWKHKEAVKIVAKYQQIMQKLSEQTISETMSQKLQDNLQAQLQKHLNNLVANLQIKAQVESLLQESLPILVQKEIKEQITPLASQFLDEKEKLKAYHNKLGHLIQTLSAKL